MAHSTRVNAYFACLVIAVVGAGCTFILLHATSGASYSVLVGNAVSTNAVSGI